MRKHEKSRESPPGMGKLREKIPKFLSKWHVMEQPLHLYTSNHPAQAIIKRDLDFLHKDDALIYICHYAL